MSNGLQRRRHKWLEVANVRLATIKPHPQLTAHLAIHVWKVWNPTVDPYMSNARIALDLGLVGPEDGAKAMETAERNIRRGWSPLYVCDLLRDNGWHQSGTVHRALWLPDDGPVNASTWRNLSTSVDRGATASATKIVPQTALEQRVGTSQGTSEGTADQQREEQQTNSVKFTDPEAIRLWTEADDLNKRGYWDRAGPLREQAIALERADALADAAADALLAD